jgi:hypothetical protein
MSEPVAWRNLCVGNIGEDSEWIYNEIGQGEPLYTHPAQTPTLVLDGNRVYPTAKTLTDEEINAEMLSYLNSKTMGLEDFAKAILRKAQEK